MATENGKQNIRLRIADRYYSLSISAEKEELYRAASDELARQIAFFNRKFKSDSEGSIAFAALQIALNYIELRNSRSLGDDLDRLAEISRNIDEHMERL